MNRPFQASVWCSVMLTLIGIVPIYIFNLLLPCGFLLGVYSALNARKYDLPKKWLPIAVVLMSAVAIFFYSVTTYQAYKNEAPPGYQRCDFELCVSEPVSYGLDLSEPNNLVKSGRFEQLDRLLGKPICLKGYFCPEGGPYDGPRSDTFCFSHDGTPSNAIRVQLDESINCERWMFRSVAVSGILELEKFEVKGAFRRFTCCYKLRNCILRPSATPFQLPASSRKSGC